jgi:glucose-1-phosphate adenylyltransferase
VTAVVLGGGRGTRLYPLTLKRAKPAVGFAGKYRIIDIPVSNCINSGIKRIFVLTQFLSTSLHRHIMRTYRFDDFSDGFVDILAAEQTIQHSDWFQGPADAVRATLNHTMYYKSEDIVILSGDQLYRMDFGRIIQAHRQSDADITICVHPVGKEEARRMGLVEVEQEPEARISGPRDRNGCRKVRRFVEKPKEDEVIASFLTPPDLFERTFEPSFDTFVASMGIYAFKPQTLFRILADTDAADFGYGIFQAALASHKVVAYPFSDYWQDIGTVGAFFDANISLAQPDGPFQLYAPGWPFYTRTRFLPPSRITGSEVRDSLVSEGAFIAGSQVVDSVVGVRSVIRPGTSLRQVVLLGEDFYEGEQYLMDSDRDSDREPSIGIGKDCTIERAIIDKNVRIGDGVVIRDKSGIRELQGEHHWVRDGVTIIPKGTVIPSRTII